MQEFTYPKRKTGYPVVRLNARLSIYGPVNQANNFPRSIVRELELGVPIQLRIALGNSKGDT